MDKIIDFCIKNKFVIIMIFAIVSFFGVLNLKATKLDALPDLSDVQVIIKTSYHGQAPKIIENQITNPLTKGLLAVPKAKTVRGFSFFGDSYVYVIFEDNTDIYWARSRVLEYLNQIKKDLPSGVEPILGPDASGVGWVYQYALVSKSHDLGELRSLQDWYLKQELQSVKGVSEVATIGGFEKNYQIILDIKKMLQHKIKISNITSALKDNNNEVGGSVVEMAEAEYMIRSKGFLQNTNNIKNIPIGKTENGFPLYLKDVATIKEGASSRRGIAELNGEGETVGGIIVMRHNENALTTINNIKEKIEEIKKGLPEDVKIITVYDRSNLILDSIENLKQKVIEEIIVVTLICFLFLLHVRSTIVAVIVIPLSILISFIIMNYFGISANIMSLGGISIAIGAIVDGSIVMIENTHKHIEKFQEEKNREPTNKERWDLVSISSKEVGGAIFASLLIITISFLPVFSLEAQEGKLFAPLAYTKTFTMLSSAFLSILLIPILMGFFVRGKIKKENKNPLNRFLINSYRPILKKALDFPKITIGLFIIITSSIYYPISNMKTEFMPELNEGDLLYMPSTFTGISVGKAKELLQQTDKLIKTVPEVKTVFGKVGRANTATDPAPLTMIETTIQLKPRNEWRKGYGLDDIIEELQSKVKIPGVTNSWVQPIKTRIDMLSTGVKTNIGIKITGANSKELGVIGTNIENILNKLPETKNIFSEKSSGGRYIEITPNLKKSALYNVDLKEIQDLIKYGVGGGLITTSIQDNERFPIILRYPRELRDDFEKIKNIPLLTKEGTYVPLNKVADIEIKTDAAMFKSENGRLINWVFINTDYNAKDYIKKAKQALSNELVLKEKYNYSFSGQFEYLDRVVSKMKIIIPITILSIFIILLILFGNIFQASVVLLTLPFALVGGIWMLYFLNYNISVAIIVGIIALLGVAAEFGVVMLVYIDNIIKERIINNYDDLREAIIDGAILRIRPKIMTVATLFLGLSPIMFGNGAGNEVLQKIAAPMIGGMITAPFLSLILIPVIYLLYYKRKL